MDPQNTTPPAPSTDTGRPSIGPAIGIIIIILVVVLGGLYFWGQRVAEENSRQLDAANAQNEAEIQNIEQQSSSDDLQSINADLEATQSANLGSEMNDVDEASNGSGSY